MSDILEKVSEFVDKCLGPLGSEGFTNDKIRDLVIQLVATIILFLVVRFFLWKPVTNILETRRTTMEKDLTEAKENNLKSRKLTTELEEKLEATHIEIRNLIDKAEKDANIRREKIISDAKEEAKKRLGVVQKEIEQEITRSSNEIHKMIVDIAFLAAQAIVEDEIDHEKYLRVVNDIIEEASKK